MREPWTDLVVYWTVICTGLVRQLSEPVGKTKRQSLRNTTPKLGDDSKGVLNPDQLEEFKMSFIK